MGRPERRGVCGALSSSDRGVGRRERSKPRRWWCALGKFLWGGLDGWRDREEGVEGEARRGGVAWADPDLAG